MYYVSSLSYIFHPITVFLHIFNFFFYLRVFLSFQSDIFSFYLFDILSYAFQNIDSIALLTLTQNPASHQLSFQIAIFHIKCINYFPPIFHILCQLKLSACIHCKQTLNNSNRALSFFNATFDNTEAEVLAMVLL